MNRISFIVTCKGRLEHLRRTLPGLVAQEGTECIVVDYDCPQQTHVWVTENFPAVRVLHVTGQPFFQGAHARNLGASIAIGNWLCFIDADIFLAAGFAQAISPLLQNGCYYRPQPVTRDTWGTHLCARADFLQIEGYDEILRGWGGEDDDLYRRLQGLGRRQANFPGTLLEAIPHDDATRTQHYEVREKSTSQRINSLYLQLKYDIALQMRQATLGLPMRQTLYDEVRRAVLQGDACGSDSTHFEVNLAESLSVPLEPGMAIKRRWIYDMGPEPGAPARKTGRFSEAIATYFATRQTRKLHIGCGDHLLDGWLNTDLLPRLPGVLPLDATQPLPFESESFDFVFSEHVIEHMPYVAGCRLLAECQRILRPGARIRIATPDLAFLLNLYRDDKTELETSYLNWSHQTFTPWAPAAEDTYIINNAVRDWGHQFIYDEKALRRALSAAGFTDITRRNLMESNVAELRSIENPGRAPAGLVALETMVLEAAKN